MKTILDQGLMGNQKGGVTSSSRANKHGNKSDDDESTVSNATSGINRSSQSEGWSGLQVNLMNHDNQQSMQEIITLDNGSTLSLLCKC